MKKVILFSSVFLSSFITLAQITLTQADYGSFGDTILVGRDTLSPVNIGGVGLQTWNFSLLQSHEIDTLFYLDPSTTPSAADFGSANLALRGPLQTDYYTLSSTGYTLEGLSGDPFETGSVASFVFSDPQKLSSFPATFNSQLSDTSVITFKYDGTSLGLGATDSIQVQRSVYSSGVFDAHGDLLLPSGTYNTLRQSSQFETTDSLYIFIANALTASLLGVPQNVWTFAPLSIFVPANPILDTTFLYSWWTNSKSHPMLIIETDTLGGSALSIEFQRENTFNVDVVSIPPQCMGGCDGQLTATPTLGVSPYTYSWGGMTQTTSQVTGLCAGTYTVTIIDSQGDQDIVNAVLEDQDGLMSNALVSDVQCYGTSTGTIIVTQEGGTSPYTYLWNTGSTTTMLVNLAEGNYTVSVTDVNGCMKDTTFVISTPDSLHGTITSNDRLCFGDDSGNSTVTLFGGTSPYFYQWSQGGTGPTQTGLPTGSFSVTVSDVANCLLVFSDSIGEPDVLEVQDSITYLEQCEVKVETTVSGGVSPYTYLWSNGLVTSSIDSTDASKGLVLTITDSNGCEATTKVDSSMSGIIVALDLFCFEDSSGTSAVVPIGGTSPYTYLWESGNTTASQIGLSAGEVQVTVTDSSGCALVFVDSIFQPDPIHVTDSVTSLTECLVSVETITTGGTLPYSYEWSEGSITSSLDSVDNSSGLVVTVTDFNGCIEMHTVDSTNCVVSSLLEENMMTMEVYPNPSAGSITLEFGQKVEDKTVRVFNLLGEQVFEKRIFEQRTEMDISHLTKGIYILKYGDGISMKSKKITLTK